MQLPALFKYLRFVNMLAKIPTRLILEESPALLGLAHLPLAA